jgi:hypothetical protein
MERTAANNCSGGSALLTKASAPAVSALSSASGWPLSTITASSVQVRRKAISRPPVEEHQVWMACHNLREQVSGFSSLSDHVRSQFLLQQESEREPYFWLVISKQDLHSSSYILHS